MKQKLYDLNYTQTNAVVTSFKNQFNNLAFNKSTNNNVTLALDSSIWILEAALNSDFDKGISDVFHDSLSITAPTTNNTILAEDIGASYLTLKSLISQKMSTNKGIELIDVNAKIIDNNIIYKLDIVFYNSSSAQKTAFTLACDPFYTETASPSKNSSFFGNHFLACPSPPALDGPTITESKLNNCGMTFCAFGYFTNITNITLYGYGYNGLYHRSALSVSDFCLPANSIISTADLNIYRNNCVTYAVNNKPTSPANVTIRNYDISYTEYSLACGCPNSYNPTWELTVKYAVLVCP